MSVDDAQDATRLRRATWLARRWLARLRSTAIVREVRSPATALLVAFCILVGLPVAIVLTPDQTVTVAGQPLSLGARKPSLSLSGPAQLVQIGNTEFDIAPLRVYGPIRPRLSLGPVQRNAAAAAALDPNGNSDVQATVAGTIGGGFLRWYGWATLVLLGFTMAAIAAVGCFRILVMLRRHGRAGDEGVTAATLWRRGVGQLSGSAAVAVVVTMATWVGAGALAYDGAVSGLRHVRSLSDLVGTYHLSPSPVGPKLRGYAGAVIGDSRAARVGGPPVAQATADDLACSRSGDSLAAEIGNVTGTRVLNLACSGASIKEGLRGPRTQGGQVVPPQVGQLKQAEGLRYVVVAIGPNDLYWADFVRYCYGVVNCRDNLTQGEFALRLAAFDRDYGELLQDLNDLPGGPQVVIMTSYDIFRPDASCADTKGPGQVPGLSQDNVRLLAEMNGRLNDVLVAGADKYRFAVARPRLSTLCEPGDPQLGRDLQGLDDSYPFHPTAIGAVRMAAAVTQVIKP